MTEQAYKTTFAHLADMKAFIGKEIGLTEWLPISQERINQFANATDDHQWIHTDPEMAAKQSPYKTTIAHGFLVLSLASKFCYESYEVGDIRMGINYGLDKVRFPNATPVNGKLRGRISLLEFRETTAGARFKLGITFELEGQRKPACVAEFLAQAYVDPNKK